jgi:hypothetical protein
MTVSAIIEKFGGTSAFATALSIPVSTAHSWKAKDYIPAWRHRDVLQVALERRLDVSAADFPEKPETSAAA